MDITRAQKAFEAHLASCEICQAASNQRYACEEGKRLHEVMVVVAHEERKDG